MKPRYNWIPTELSQSDFHEFVFSHITSGRRGPKPKISYFKMFNYFLYLMVSDPGSTSITVKRLEYNRI